MPNWILKWLTARDNYTLNASVMRHFRHEDHQGYATEHMNSTF